MPAAGCSKRMKGPLLMDDSSPSNMYEKKRAGETQAPDSLLATTHPLTQMHCCAWYGTGPPRHAPAKGHDIACVRGQGLPKIAVQIARMKASTSQGLGGQVQQQAHDKSTGARQQGQCNPVRSFVTYLVLSRRSARGSSRPGQAGGGNPVHPTVCSPQTVRASVVQQQHMTPQQRAAQIACLLPITALASPYQCSSCAYGMQSCTPASHHVAAPCGAGHALGSSSPRPATQPRPRPIFHIPPALLSRT